MISSKFYSQVTVCPVCLGWGTNEAPPKRQNNVCRECFGQGVSVTQSDNVYVWNAPSYVDYAGRNRALILKISAVIFGIALVVMFLFAIRLMLSNLIATPI